jgi:hypothetical protein
LCGNEKLLLPVLMRKVPCHNINEIKQKLMLVIQN